MSKVKEVRVECPVCRVVHDDRSICTTSWRFLHPKIREWTHQEIKASGSLEARRGLEIADDSIAELRHR